MRKIHLFAIAALAVCVMASCDNKKTNKNWADEEDEEDIELVDEGDEEDSEEASDEIAVAPEDLWTEEAVADMLRRAYADVSIVFGPREDGLEPNLDLDGIYCTQHWNEVLRQVRAASYQQTSAGKQGYNEAFHWNYWMEGKVSPENIKVTLLTGNMAEATFQLTHGEEWLYTHVALDFEDGQWRISDWLEIGDTPNSVLQEMEHYVERAN